MDVEEVRKRKGEAEAAIKNILLEYMEEIDVVLKIIEDIDTDVTKIEFRRQVASGEHSAEMVDVIMKVELLSK